MKTLKNTEKMTNKTPYKPFSSTKILFLMFTFIEISVLLINLSIGAEGDYVTKWSLTEGHSDSYGMTSNGTYIWITNRSTNYIYRYFTNGTYNSAFSALAGAGIGSYENFLWVGGPGTDVYKYFANNGTYTGETWSTAGETTDIRGITTNGTFIWVNQGSDGTDVDKYFMNGTYTQDSFSTSDIGAPMGMANNGTYIWITDITNDEVYKYYINGTYTQDHWDTAGSGNNQPNGIALNETFYWVVDHTDKEVHVYATALSTESTVSLISPSNDTTISTQTQNFTVHYNISTENFNWTNATYYIWYNNGTVFNNTVFVEITNQNNKTTEDIDAFILGTYLWNVYACYENTTWSDCIWAEKNHTLNVGAKINTEYYANNTYETAREIFNATISLVAGTILYDAQLFYNGTFYNVDVTDDGEGDYTLKSSLDIPIITGESENKTFHWRLIYPLGSGTFTYQNLSTNTQNVSKIEMGICNGLTNEILNFTAWHEENLTRLFSYNFYGTFEYWVGSGDVRKNFSVSNASINEVEICIKPNMTYYSDAKIQYEKTNFVKRSYYLINATLTNSSQDIKLILLPTSASTSFIIDVIDNNQLAIENSYIYIQRYYPGTGTYETVEMALTDSSGSTIGHFEVETEDYRIIIQQNGEVIYQSGTQKIFCEETPCKLTFQTKAGAGATWTNFGDVANLIWSLEFNENTNIWTYTYVDTSGLTQQGRLYVYYETGKGKQTICNVTSSSASATLTCDVTGYDGTFYAEIYISRSPELFVYIKTAIIKALKDIFGLEGLFLMVFVLIILGAVGLWNPAVGIILTIGGIIIFNFIGIASFGITTIIGLIIIGFILLWELKT